MIMVVGQDRVKYSQKVVGRERYLRLERKRDKCCGKRVIASVIITAFKYYPHDTITYYPIINKLVKVTYGV